MPTASPSAVATQAASAGLPLAHSECAIIDAVTAARLLGGKATHASTPDTSSATITHLDRCNWTAGLGTLGYQLDRYATAGMPTQVVANTKAAMNKQRGATLFTMSGDSVAFTVAIGGKTMARAAVAVNNDLAIDLVATGPDAASAKKILKSAADLVLARTK
ncbi:MAG: hypothetical protein IT193_18510 [Propionibacteriaceae bacterium]|nr:hypothetical protein [Propionibacteriaceae bacterium]